jgi:hypothetical protein
LLNKQGYFSPLSTPTGEHFRVGHALAQLDTVKLHQTGIALPTSDWNVQASGTEGAKKIQLGVMRESWRRALN